MTHDERSCNFLLIDLKQNILTAKSQFVGYSVSTLDNVVQKVSCTF